MAAVKKTNERSRLIKLIQIAKRQLGMADEDYRAILQRCAGVDSSTKATVQGLDGVLAELKTKGFMPVQAKKPRVGFARKDRMAKIEALMADMKLPWAYGDGIAKQMFGIERLQFCDEAQLSKIIAALVYRQKKQEGANHAAKK